MPFSWAAASASEIAAATIQDSIDGETALRNQLIERSALDEFHREEVDTADFFERVYRDDVGMIERSEHPGFALETREPPGVVYECRRNNFDGHAAAELGVAGPIDIAHAACAEARENFVGSETRADRQLLRLHGRLGEETRLCLLVRGNERFHFPAQVRFRAGLVQIGRPFAGRPIQGAGEHSLDFLPAFRRHAHYFFLVGTFCFSSSNQLSTTLICVAAWSCPPALSIKKRWPSCEIS